MFLDCLLGVKQLYIYDSLEFYIQVCHLIFNALFKQNKKKLTNN